MDTCSGDPISLINSVKNNSTSNNLNVVLVFTSSKTTIDFLQGDITFSNCSLNNFTPSGSKIYTAEFVPSSPGVCSINVSASGFHDSVGNGNVAAPTFTWTHEGKTHLNQNNIKTAVDNWCTNASGAEVTYGNIKLWKTCLVTDMSGLFENKINFNEDLSGWDTANVTNLPYSSSS